MRRTIRTVFLALIGCFALVASAHAQELPPGVFLMHDGNYFQPSSGFVTSDLSLMLAHLSTSTQQGVPLSQVSTTTTGGGVIAPVDSTSTSAADASSTSLVFPLKAAIVRAQAMLNAQIDPKAKPLVLTADDGWRDITLVIWNPSTDALRLVTGKKEGTKLTNLSPGAGSIRITYSNGVNSSFVIPNEVVVAIKYPIYDEKKLSKKKSEFLVHDVVYTPYSKALHTPQMVAEGKRWFDQQVAQVYADLRSAKIPSRAFPGKQLADVIDPSFVKSIAIIEHTDEGVLNGDMSPSIETFFVQLASNETDTFDYSRSSAGALGLVQFIPSTYKSIASKWPTLHLNPDFEVGMRDPENAMRAQAAYLDYLLACLPDEAKTAYASDRSRANEYIAAAYNAGPTIVAKAMQVWNENFDSAERPHVLKRSRLRLETMNYVLKLRKLQQLVLADASVLVDSGTVRAATSP